MPYNDLQFVDNLTGWVRGKVNELRRTTDGGVNWHPVAPLDEGVTGIQFVDRKHGWTFGTAAELMDPVVVDWTWQARSTNGGMSWSGSGRPGVAVFYLDANNGWGVGFEETTWYRCGDILGMQLGLLAGPHHRRWRELDPAVGEWWAHYSPEPDRSPSRMNGLVAADPERVWTWGTHPVVGGPIAASTDGGATWINQRAEAVHVSEVRFDRTGLAYAFSDSTLRYRNTEISAYHAYRPPQIDGNLADWTGVPVYVLSVERAYRVSSGPPLRRSTPARPSRPPGTQATSTSRIRVDDDAVKVDSGAKPWQDDAIEIGLDGRHDHVRNWALDDDRQFTVTALGQIYETGNFLTDVPVARVGTSNGYILEFAIPKAKLGKHRCRSRGDLRPQLGADRRR